MKKNLTKTKNKTIRKHKKNKTPSPKKSPKQTKKQNNQKTNKETKQPKNKLRKKATTKKKKIKKNKSKNKTKNFSQWKRSSSTSSFDLPFPSLLLVFFLCHLLLSAILLFFSLLLLPTFLFHYLPLPTTSWECLSTWRKFDATKIARLFENQNLLLYVFTKQAGCDRRSVFFNQSLAGLNSKFSFF